MRDRQRKSVLAYKKEKKKRNRLRSAVGMLSHCLVKPIVRRHAQRRRAFAVALAYVSGALCRQERTMPPRPEPRFIVPEETIDLESYPAGNFPEDFRIKKRDFWRLCKALKVPDRMRFPVGTKDYTPWISGPLAMAIVLKRLATPGRLYELTQFFGGISRTSMGNFFNGMCLWLFHRWDHKLHMHSNYAWLQGRIPYYSACIRAKFRQKYGVAIIKNAWGFGDATRQKICRPTRNQRVYYSGYKKKHQLKYQGVSTPDGLVVDFTSAYPGYHNDAYIFHDTDLVDTLRRLTRPLDRTYAILCDSAYPHSDVVYKPFPRPRNRALFTPEHRAFNKCLSSIREGVEWAFGDIKQHWQYLDYSRYMRAGGSNVSVWFSVGALLTNCRTCLYPGLNSQYFDCDPPELEDYLR